MGDRVFLKPEPFELPAHVQTLGPTARLYPAEAFFGEFVWPFDKWGTTEDWGDAQIRIGDLLEATAPGRPIVLSLEDYEKLREAVRAAKIGGSFAHKLRRMARQITSAKPVDSAEGKLLLGAPLAPAPAPAPAAEPAASANGSS
jgi:hypothetical protein